MLRFQSVSLSTGLPAVHMDPKRQPAGRARNVRLQTILSAQCSECRNSHFLCVLAVTGVARQPAVLQVQHPQGILQLAFQSELRLIFNGTQAPASSVRPPK